MTNIIYDLTNYAALKALTGDNLSGRKNVAYKSSATDNLGGMFVWDGSDLSDEVAADPDEYNFVVPTAKLANGTQGAFKRLRQRKPDAEWGLLDFPGATLDDKLTYALANVDAGTRIILPSCDTEEWLDFEAPQEANLQRDYDRWFEIVGHNAKVRWQGGADTWLTAMGDSPALGNPRLLIKGLVMMPAVANHWTGGGIKISDTGFVHIDRCRIWRFGTGIHLLNSDSGYGWTEQSVITNSEIYGNRIGILGSADGTSYSQRGTHISNCFISCGYNRFDLVDWVRDDTGDEATVIHYGIVVRDVSWYNGVIHTGLGLKRSYCTGIWLDGGTCLNVDFFVDLEGMPSADHCIGLRLTNHSSRKPDLSAATGVMKILALQDEVNSMNISDERTDIDHRHGFGEVRIEGKGFYDPLATPPTYTQNYYVIPATTSLEQDAWNSTFRLPGGIILPDGTALREEWLTYYKDALAQFRSDVGYSYWTQRYLVPDLTLRTNYSGSDQPLPVRCAALNDYTSDFATFSTEDWITYIDITDVNPGILTLRDDADLYQIRGGRLGQIIQCMVFRSYTRLKHTLPLADTAAIDLGAGYAQGVTTVHMDALGVRAQPGYVFTVAGDDNEYTITACTALTGTDADVTFTPGIVPLAGWADNAVVTITTRNILSIANAMDYWPQRTYRAKTFQYQYHANAGYFWADIGASESDDTVYRVQSYLGAGQLRTLRASPLTCIPASGTGYANVLVGIQFWYDYATAALTVAGDNDLEARYTDGSGELLGTLECTGFLDQSSDQYRWLYPTTTSGITPVDNAAIVLKMAGAAEITGNSATGTLNFRAFYRRIEMTWDVPGSGYW